MEKRIAHLEKKIQQQLVEAKKKHQKKDKRGAIMCMKRKKMYEAQVRARCGSRDSSKEFYTHIYPMPWAYTLCTLSVHSAFKTRDASCCPLRGARLCVIHLSTRIRVQGWLLTLLFAGGSLFSLCVPTYTRRYTLHSTTSH